jgi:hypothetical protein
MQIHQLPTDLIGVIISFLGDFELFMTGTTCKGMMDIAQRCFCQRYSRMVEMVKILQTKIISWKQKIKNETGCEVYSNINDVITKNKHKDALDNIKILTITMFLVLRERGCNIYLIQLLKDKFIDLDFENLSYTCLAEAYAINGQRTDFLKERLGIGSVNIQYDHLLTTDPTQISLNSKLCYDKYLLKEKYTIYALSIFYYTKGNYTKFYECSLCFLNGFYLEYNGRNTIGCTMDILIFENLERLILQSFIYANLTPLVNEFLKHKKKRKREGE